jgi:protein TonB
MFEQTFVTGPAQTRRPWTVAVSLTLQTVLVLVILILPLLHIAALHAPDKLTIWVPLQIPPQAVRPAAAQTSTIAPRAARNIFVAPARIPNRIDMTPDLAASEIAPALPDAGPSGPMGFFGSVLSGVQTIQPPPQPPPAATRTSPPADPLHVSGGAQAARLVFAPKPGYPQLARAARVQGVVRLQAVIAINGAIKNLHVVTGPPLLVAAALAAVEQWRYQPTLLSGQPVEVATEIEVNFTLSQ